MTLTTVTKMEMRPIGSLVPYARNARVHSEQQIAALRASIREFGVIAPLLIDGNGNIVAGHGRYQAALLEGVEELPCVLVEHLSQTQLKAYTLVDNRLAEQATWDTELVSMELEALRDAGFDLALTGFDESDILLPATPETEEDNFDPVLPEEPRSKPGQIWQLGRHRLMCGDAANPEQVSALLGGAKMQLLLTDPPYNVDYTGGDGTPRDGLIGDNASDDDYSALLYGAFANAAAALELGAAFYVWHAGGYPARTVRNALHIAGLAVRQCLVWVKQTATLSRSDYQWRHEPCLYGWRDGAKHVWHSDRKQTTVLEFDRPAKSEIHPTMKPVKLFGYLIENSTPAEAAVLDLFAGSGTTAIAYEQLGRTAYMMEIDPRYVDAIIDRWEAQTGGKAVLLDAP